MNEPMTTQGKVWQPLENPRGHNAEEMAAWLRWTTGQPESRIRAEDQRLVLDRDTIAELVPMALNVFSVVFLGIVGILAFHSLWGYTAAGVGLTVFLFLLAGWWKRNLSEYDILDRFEETWSECRILAGHRREWVRFPFARMAGLGVKVIHRARGETDPRLLEQFQREGEGGHVSGGEIGDMNSASLASFYGIYARLDNGMDFLLADLNCSDFERSQAAARALAEWINKKLLEM